MKSYSELAELTGTTVDDVQEAMLGAEKSYHGHGWFVAIRSASAYGEIGQREQRSIGNGKTREKAVIDALNNREKWSMYGN